MRRIARERIGWAVAIAVTAGAVATCAYRPPPVPVSGDPETIGYLAGEWAGSYQGAETGRTGSIFFRLAARADTAYGDVLIDRFRPMHTADELEEPPGIHAPPVLTIRFVRASGDMVYGTLDEYEDPDCRCRVQTSFTGRIERDRLEGRFTTTHLATGDRHGGSWSVRRTGPPPPAETLIAGSEPPGEPGVGPDEGEMIAQGRALFRDLGCAFCHGADRQGRIGPPVGDVAEHRSFAWIYRMVLNPDSMVRHDPLAEAMYRDFELEMPDRGATPWEALLLYEYLVAEAGREAAPPPR